MWLKIISSLEKVLGKESLIAQKKFVELCIFIGPIIAQPCPLTDSLLLIDETVANEEVSTQVVDIVTGAEIKVTETLAITQGSLFFKCVVYCP